jgi:hypothetical protein
MPSANFGAKSLLLASTSTRTVLLFESIDKIFPRNEFSFILDREFFGFSTEQEKLRSKQNKYDEIYMIRIIVKIFSLNLLTLKKEAIRKVSIIKLQLK